MEFKKLPEQLGKLHRKVDFPRWYPFMSVPCLGLMAFENMESIISEGWVFIQKQKANYGWLIYQFKSVALNRREYKYRTTKI